MIKLGDRFDVGRREPVTIRESFQLIDGRVAE